MTDKLSERIRSWALDNGDDEKPAPAHVGVPPLFLYGWADEVAALEQRVERLEGIERAAQEWADLRGKPIYQSEKDLMEALASQEEA